MKMYGHIAHLVCLIGLYSQMYGHVDYLVCLMVFAIDVLETYSVPRTTYANSLRRMLM